MDNDRGTAAVTPSSPRTWLRAAMGMSDMNPSRLITIMRFALASSGTSWSHNVAKPYIIVSIARHRAIEIAVSVERSLLRVALRNGYLRKRMLSSQGLGSPLPIEQGERGRAKLPSPVGEGSGVRGFVGVSLEPLGPLRSHVFHFGRLQGWEELDHEGRQQEIGGELCLTRWSPPKGSNERS